MKPKFEVGDRIRLGSRDGMIIDFDRDRYYHIQYDGDEDVDHYKKCPVAWEDKIRLVHPGGYGDFQEKIKDRM